MSSTLTPPASTNADMVSVSTMFPDTNVAEYVPSPLSVAGRTVPVPLLVMLTAAPLVGGIPLAFSGVTVMV